MKKIRKINASNGLITKWKIIQYLLNKLLVIYP